MTYSLLPLWAGRGWKMGSYSLTRLPPIFDAPISNDRGLEYERDQAALPLAVIVLLAPANTIEAIRPLYPALDAALSSLLPRSLVKVSA